MKLAHSKTALLLEFDSINVLVVEKKAQLVNYIIELRNQLDTSEGGFVLSDDKILPLEKVTELIVDPWSLDFNSKKIKSKLYKVIQDLTKEESYDEFLNLRSTLYRYLEDVTFSLPYPIVYDMEVSSDAIFKLVNLQIDNEEGGFLERVINYIKLLKKLCSVQLIVFLNLKNYLDPSELQSLYREATLQELTLLLIESKAGDEVEGEKVTIFDKDSCIISLN